MVLAIENRMGLKYLAGAPEDHTGRAYEGVEGYRRRTPSPRTFSRNELRRLFQRHFEQVEIHIALPDYKLPTLVLNEDFAGDRRSAELFAGNAPAGGDSRGLREASVGREMVLAGLGAEIGNSFIVLAHTDSSEQAISFGDLAVQYSEYGDRRPTRVTTIRQVDEGVESTKSLIGPYSEWPDSPVFWRPETPEFWQSGESALHRAVDLAQRSSGVDGIVPAIEPWITALESSTSRGRLPENHLDATWSNCIVDGGSATFIDLEWSVTGGVPVLAPLLRSCRRFLTELRSEHVPSRLRLRSEYELARQICPLLGVDFDDQVTESSELLAELSWVAFGGDRRLLLAAETRRQRLSAIVPLYEESKPLVGSARRTATKVKRKARGVVQRT